MTTITFPISGDRIAGYQTEIASGNGILASATVLDLRPFTSRDVFTVKVEQTNGADGFRNGQFVTIYDKNGDILRNQVTGQLMERMNPRGDEFQDRAGSSHHQIFSDQNVLIDLYGVRSGLMNYNLLNDDGGRLPFKCFQQAPCFLEGTEILLHNGYTVEVEHVGVGRKIWTKDGYADVVYVTSHLVNEPLYEINGLITTGQHRILYTNDKGQVGLIRAKHHPQAHETIFDKPQRVYSIFTDRHCILNADGVWCESSYPGPELRKLIGPDATAELTDVLGDLDDYCAHPAAPFLNKHGRVKG